MRTDINPSTEIIHTDTVDHLVSRLASHGLEFEYLPGALEIREYSNGYRGVYATEDLKTSTVILKQKRNGQGMTHLKAYEETLPLLKKLGQDRFELESNFLIALAIYQRARNNIKDDPFLPTNGLKEQYSGTPLECFNSPEICKLQHPNNNKVLNEASWLIRCINTLEIDESILRIAMGVARSRCWSKVGMLPVFDLFNSTYHTNENLKFIYHDNTYYFKLSKDVPAGEELGWTYNNKNAMDTWFGYGYLSRLRKFHARITKKMSLIHAQTINIISQRWPNLNTYMITNHMVDKTIAYFNLYCPGPDLNEPTVLKKEILESIEHFMSVLKFFRLSEYILESPEDISDEQLSDFNNYDFKRYADFEYRTLGSMLSALAEGKMRDTQLIKEFQSSRFGHKICFDAFNEITLYSEKLWRHLIKSLQKICKADRLEDCVYVVKEIIGDDNITSANVLQALNRSETQEPSLAKTLVTHYLRAKNFMA